MNQQGSQRKFYEQLLATRPNFAAGNQQPPLRNGNLALTSTSLTNGATAEIARRHLALGNRPTQYHSRSTLVGWRRRDLNPQPPPCKGGALPVELRPRPGAYPCAHLSDGVVASRQRSASALAERLRRTMNRTAPATAASARIFFTKLRLLDGRIGPVRPAPCLRNPCFWAPSARKHPRGSGGRPPEDTTGDKVRALRGHGCPEPVGLGGLEPPTSSLSAKRSNRLSYRPP